MKEVFKPEICINLPLELIKYIKYVQRLKFDQKPNYEYMEKLFKIEVDIAKSPKLQIQQNQFKVIPNLLNLKGIVREQGLTTRKSLHQQDNTSRRISLEDLSSTGADIMQELDKDEVGIKQPQILNSINKLRTESAQIFEFKAKLITNQLPISLKQSS
ncbi:unnamed protein product [Paramecium octaurelia]|uniref:Uncharacterized protein n=1 Tax=Paramecium octaurelia TaxID=43137 RepID=A0A8S1Y484_PAROT|nr:unnamed protein product [Paramecium octaurelia]